MGKRYSQWMGQALAEAAVAEASGDVPVGAVVVDEAGQIIAARHNEREQRGDPTAHAEVLAIQDAASAIGQWRLEGCTIVVTLEPCVMCAGAILAARIPGLVFAAWDEKAGAAGSMFDLLRDRRLNHQVEVVAEVEADAAGRMLHEFFERQRGRGKQ